MTTDNTEAREFVLHMVRDNDVKFIRLWFTDILGHLKGFAITVEELRSALEFGKGFDGSSIRGFDRTDESDMIAKPDPATFTLLPWRPKKDAVAKMFCDIVTPHGEPFEGDPRQVLRRNLKRAAGLGYTYYVGPELEFFYFKSNSSTEVLDQGGIFDQTSLDVGSDMRRETVLTLEQMGIPVEYSHHEAAPSQHEIDLRYADALTMADNVMTYRTVVKQIAMKHDVYATFMPKPVYGLNGSAMHTNMSIFMGERNAFYDYEDPDHLSHVGKQFLAGLLRYSPEIYACHQSICKLLQTLGPRLRGPSHVFLGPPEPVPTSCVSLISSPAVRTVLVSNTGHRMRPATRTWPSVFMLAAGLQGIEEGMSPPPRADSDETVELDTNGAAATLAEQLE